jgi:hypothetical protein
LCCGFRSGQRSELSPSEQELLARDFSLFTNDFHFSYT